MGEIEENDRGTKTYVGSESYLTFHIWSDYPGKLEVINIVSRIRALLHQAELSLTGHRLILLRFHDLRILMDADGETRHAILEFKAYTHETA